MSSASPNDSFDELDVDKNPLIKSLTSKGDTQLDIEVDPRTEREMRIRFGCFEYITDNILTILNVLCAWLGENPAHLDYFNGNNRPLKVWSTKLANTLNKILPLYSFIKDECSLYTMMSQNHQIVNRKLVFLTRITQPRIREEICEYYLDTKSTEETRSTFGLPEDHLLNGIESLKNLHSKLFFDVDFKRNDHHEISTVFTIYRIKRLIEFAEVYALLAKNLDVEFDFTDKSRIKSDDSFLDNYKSTQIISDRLRQRHKKSKKRRQNSSRRHRNNSRRDDVVPLPERNRQTPGSLDYEHEHGEKPVEVKTIIANMDDSPAMSKDQVMRKLAKMRLASEIDNLKTKVHQGGENDNTEDRSVISPDLIGEKTLGSNLPPCLLLDSATVIGHTEFIKTIVKSKYFLIIVPEAVIGHLDYLKTKTVLARTAIRFLEQSASNGNEAFQIQKSNEFPSTARNPNYQPYKLAQKCSRKGDGQELSEPSIDQESDSSICHQRTIKRYTNIIYSAIYQAYKISKDWQPENYVQAKEMCSDGHVDLFDPKDFNIRSPFRSNVSIVLSNKFRRSACGLEPIDCTIPKSLLSYAHAFGVDFTPITLLMDSFKNLKKKNNRQL